MGTVVETSTATSSYTVETIPGGEPLGVENGTIPDDCISASSSAGPAPPHLARLNGLSAWCAGKAEDCYLQVNLGSLHLLCAVATQGNPGGNRDYVKRYKLKSSVDGENWSTYEENGNDIIEGNTNNWGAKKKELEKEIITRYVRFCPVDWYCWPCLRVELYGAALNIADKFPNIQSEDGGSYVVEKVLVTTYETHVDENGVPDEDSLKEQEKQIIRDAKERQRIEEEQQNRLEEIQIFIEQEEVKRKPSVEDMDDDERKEAEARIQLVLSEELALERREKPDGEDRLHRDVEEEKHDRVTREYNRIDEEHRKRMEALTAIIGDDEERRRKEKEERRKEEENARRKREEERRAKEDELKRKREEERLKWEEEHRKWEEERKKRDQELEALLEEGRKKRAEERKKRDEELRKMREDDRRKREEERKKRMDEEMRKLDQLKKEREERWNKKTEVVISGIDLDVSGKEGEDAKNRQDDKKRKEDGWMKRVKTPRMVEEEMKKFRDEERKRLEEERKRLLEKEIADAEAEKELKSEIRVMRQEKPETITKVSVASIQLATPQDIGEEKRRIEWRMQKIEQDRLLREEEEKKRREQADRKKKEDEERAMQEVERIRREQEEERERRKEEMRLRKEADERKKREEEDRKRQEEEARRHMTLEERRKRLEEDRKKREDEERVWRREMEERKRREEEEKRKEEENKKRKRLSIDRKRFEEEEIKRLDEIGRKRSEEEEKERMEDERRRREERERWKLKQAERRRSGEIYRNKSEEDLRKREERYSFKEKQRKQRDSKSFEIKWEFINGERVAVPVDESFVSATSETSYSEPNGSDVFDDDTPEISYVTANTVEARRIPSTDEQDSSRVTSTIRVITTTTTRTRYHDHHDHHHPRHDSEETSLNGEVMPFRSQPHCDHLLPTDPSVQEAVEMSFFDKYEENEGKLRPFPSWYGGLDMGSLPHLYLPSNPIRDSDIDLLVSIENEGLKSWKRVKKSGELEIYSRKGLERGSPPVTKAIMVLKDIPYRDAIDLVSDWDERSKWDKTFDGVSFLDQMADFKLLKCSQKKKNRCAVLASLDREDEEPYYAWAWKGSNHPSVPGEDSKLTVMRLETGICGAIIRPYHDATRSSKITIITQVRGSVPSPLKSTYLTGNPSKWLIWMKKHHNSQVKTTMDKEQDDDKNKDDASSVSSKSDKQD